MKELPEDNLDGLFRKSAEEFEPTFNPADWQVMKARLDEYDQRTFWEKWITRGLIGLIVLFVIGVSWYSWQVMNAGGASTRPKSGLPAGVQSVRQKKGSEWEDPNQQTASKLAEQVTVSKRVASDLPGKTGQAGRSPMAGVTTMPQRNGERIDPNLKRERAVPDDGLAIPARGITREQYGRKPQAYAATETEQGSLLPVEQATKLVSRPRQHAANPKWRLTPATETGPLPEERTNDGTKNLAKTMVKPEALPVMGQSEKPEQPTTDMPQKAVPLTFEVNSLESRPLQWPVFDTLDDQVVIAPEMAVRPPAKAKTKVNGVSVRAVLSPDLTTVGLKNFTRPGSLIGLSVEYRFTNRWSLQVGGLWNKKVYDAYGSEYAWPWPNRPTPKEVYSACKMIDIPVNLRYDFLRVPRPSGNEARGFVTAGVTGFKILKEKYDYVYEPTTQHVYYRSWEGASGWGGVSHLNVSAGYEHPLTRRLAWQVEPFLKIPLKGVGFFKMNLMTTGAFLSLRYKL